MHIRLNLPYTVSEEDVHKATLTGQYHYIQMEGYQPSTVKSEHDLEKIDLSSSEYQVNVSPDGKQLDLYITHIPSVNHDDTDFLMGDAHYTLSLTLPNKQDLDTTLYFTNGDIPHEWYTNLHKQEVIRLQPFSHIDAP